ncbi:MAG: glycoside hydrolase clan [Pedosphaera sp.]|nr:glycoside hydrolase clan [Pedosphaera sp.]
MLALIPAPRAQAVTNGLALTPPMGWNSWYANGSGITEQTIKDAANAMATNGMKAAGYEYVCMDDGWAGYRDTNGVMVADPIKFPSGIKALADYVHAKGFKFGIYTVFGQWTCANLPGSYGHVVQDANTYAGWGIDFLKYEGCSFPNPLAHEQEQCELMGNALLATGRPIVYNMSIGPAEAWMTNDLNMFRGTGDAAHKFDSMVRHLDFVAQTPELAGPGHWNDPDVLESGYFSKEDLRTQFTMWCMVAAPLLNTTYTVDLDILTNREVIAVDQDPAGVQGVCVATNGALQVWCKPLGSNGVIKAVALLNRGTNTGTITANWSDLGLPAGFASVRDLWAYAYAGNFTNSFTATIPGHGVRLLKIVPGARAPLPPPGTNYLSDLNWLSSTTNPYPIPLDKDTAGHPITMHGITYPKGLGAHAPSHIEYLLEGTASRFKCDVGVDDDGCCGIASVIFQVLVDGAKVYDSGIVTSETPTRSIDVDISGGNILTLDVLVGASDNRNDHADWANARIVVPARPKIGAATLHGNKMEISVTGGLPNGTGYLLSSTNPALPMAQWVRLATNQFDGGGNLTCTNLTSPNAPRMFYRLQLP